ncbi:MAG: preprotein translocase subunit SecE [Planctomycetales bacterium]|nr:preprotein translocase subunit SecE [Planctomycetales bacterium]
MTEPTPDRKPDSPAPARPGGLHRWGQGMWARGTAWALCAIFIFWFALTVFQVPARQAWVVQKSQVLTKERLEALAEHAGAAGVADGWKIHVDGLSNQAVSDLLLGAKATRQIAGSQGQEIVPQGGEFTKERIESLRQEKIRRVPVQEKDGVNRDEIPLDDTWLLGRLAAETVDEAPRLRLHEAGLEVTPENVEKIRGDLAQSAVPLKERPVEVLEDGKPGSLKEPLELRVGHKLLGPVLAKERGPKEVVVKAGEAVTRAHVEKIRAADVPRKGIRVRDDGEITIRSGSPHDFLGFTLVSSDSVERPTFWTRPLLGQVPVVDLDLSAGFLISVGVGLALGYFVIFVVLNKPRVADFLIETEVEMKKVSWPKGRELVGSSGVVIACIATLAIYLYVVDLALASLANVSGLYRSTSAGSSGR